MNTSIFYLTATVWALAGFWILWQFGVRPLMLDNFRDSLFAKRDQLYLMAQQGRIKCDSEAYRAVEQVINGVIRYAHRFTFSSYVLGRVEIDRARARGEDVDFAGMLFAKVAAVESPDLRRELEGLLVGVGTLIPQYVAKSSLLFFVCSLVYVIVRHFQPVFAVAKKKEAVSAFEREAYLASQADVYA